MYNLNCKFDIEKHSKQYPHYLEVIIDSEGIVHYAVPSHSEKLIEIACRKHQCSREELNNMCPPEYYADFLYWLMHITGCAAVWTMFIQYDELTEAQKSTLIQLKDSGVYEGILPNFAEM